MTPKFASKTSKEIFDFAVRLSYEEPQARNHLLPILKGEKKETVESLRVKLAYLLSKKGNQEVDQEALNKVIVRIKKMLFLADPDRNESVGERDAAFNLANSLIAKHGLDPYQFLGFEKALKGLRILSEGEKVSFEKALNFIDQYFSLHEKMSRGLEKFNQMLRNTRNIAYKEPFHKQLEIVEKALGLNHKMSYYLRRVPDPRKFEIRRRAAFRLINPIKYTNLDIEDLISKGLRMGLKNILTTMLWNLTTARSILNKAFKGNKEADNTIKVLTAFSQNVYFAAGAISNVFDGLQELIHQKPYEQAPMKAPLVSKTNTGPVRRPQRPAQAPQGARRQPQSFPPRRALPSY